MKDLIDVLILVIVMLLAGISFGLVLESGLYGFVAGSCVLMGWLLGHNQMME